jgi:hypothetical protein
LEGVGVHVTNQFTDLDRALPVDDFGNDTLLVITERLEQSSRYQHFILREAELDDVWRHIETAIKVAHAQGREGADVEELQHLLDAVMAAHDLVADGDAREAAARLRAVMR